jgi:tryptophan synthase alpha chain
MSRLSTCFSAAAAEGRKVLVAYLCVGDPSLDESVQIALACVEAGADVLELGVPFSDPSADGPVIARASERALKGGGGLLPTLEVASRIRRASSVPLVLFGYLNPLYVRGLERSVDEVAAAGVDALLVVDAPVEEATELRAAADGRKLAVVPLLTPTTSDRRLATVAETARRHDCGFAYYVSVTGVTGTAAAPLREASAAAGRARAKLGGLPVVVGFGIDSGDKARLATADADGAVVGTAIVRAIEAGETPEARLRNVRAVVGELRQALGS